MKKLNTILLTIILTLSILFAHTSTIQAIDLQQHHITESIVYCTQSIYNPFTQLYDSTMIDENGEAYILNFDENVKTEWYVLIIDTMNTNNIKDDEIIKVYLLDNYKF